MKYKVLAVTSDSIVIEDHTQPKQTRHAGDGLLSSYPVQTIFVGDATGIEVGDEVEIKVVTYPQERSTTADE